MSTFSSRDKTSVDDYISEPDEIDDYAEVNTLLERSSERHYRVDELTYHIKREFPHSINFQQYLIDLARIGRGTEKMPETPTTALFRRYIDDPGNPDIDTLISALFDIEINFEEQELACEMKLAAEAEEAEEEVEELNLGDLEREFAKIR